MQASVTDMFAVDTLSKRETQILRLAATGLTDKEIAVKAGVSLCTIRTYWERVRQKMKVPNRAAAIATFINGSIAARTLPSASPDQLMREAVDAALGGILVLDLEGVIVGANETGQDLLGVEPDYLPGHHISELISRQYEAFHVALSRVASGLESVTTVPAFAKVHGTRSLLVHVTVRAIDRHDGRYVVLFIQDAVEELDARRRGTTSRIVNWSGVTPVVHLS
jgi:PAS domain S-box-containing protein